MAAKDNPRARTDSCLYCQRAVWLAEDGAWEDESGACGCGIGEHVPASEHPELDGMLRDVEDAAREG